MTPLDVRQSFCVMLHDVAPRFAPQVAEFTRTLSPLVGNAMSAAMVPCWDGEPLADRDRPFLERVRNEYANILLHGFLHRRPRGTGVVSLFASGKDEMNGYTADETDRCLAAGQEVLSRWMGKPATGFIPPCYQWGHVTPERLARVGIHYGVGYRNVQRSGGESLRLSSWIWDVSPIRLLCRAGYRLGNIQYRLQTGALPCVTLHPLDIDRGFLPQITRTVERLIRDGRRPVLLEDFGFGQPRSSAGTESSPVAA